MSATIAFVVLVVGMVALVIARSKIRQTTLVATWWWSVTALTATAGFELAAAWQLIDDSATLVALRYATRMLLVCPTIASLGVRRPQDGPWNFIVLSLWGILALPAAEALFLNTGQPLEIHGFRSWFVLALVLVSLANTLPTRHWPAALAAGGGQILLLNDYLPGPISVSGFPFGELGFSLLAVAASEYALQPPRKAAASTLDRLWLDFRDSFGLFWGLRVQERIAAAAKMYQWPVTLHWTGWKTADGEPLPDQLRGEIMTTFRGLLRRFVSNEWIDSRLPP